MLKVEINEKKYEIPQSFEELTLEQYCKAFYKLPKIEDEMEEIDKFKLMKENEAVILSRIMGEKDDFCLDLPLNVYAQLQRFSSYGYQIKVTTPCTHKVHSSIFYRHSISSFTSCKRSSTVASPETVFEPFAEIISFILLFSIKEYAPSGTLQSAFKAFITARSVS